MPSSDPPPHVLAALADDPAARAHLAAREEARLAAEAEFHADEGALLAALAAVGVAEGALARHFAGDPLTGAAIGVLVAHLPRPYAPAVWERIVRSLARHEARPALPMLCTAYRFERGEARRAILAQSIGRMATFAEVRDLPGIEAHAAHFGASYAPPPVRRPSAGA